jgi:hypothetical protein
MTWTASLFFGFLLCWAVGDVLLIGYLVGEWVQKQKAQPQTEDYRRTGPYDWQRDGI